MFVRPRSSSFIVESWLSGLSGIIIFNRLKCVKLSWIVVFAGPSWCFLLPLIQISTFHLRFALLRGALQWSLSLQSSSCLQAVLRVDVYITITFVGTISEQARVAIIFCCFSANRYENRGYKKLIKWQFFAPLAWLNTAREFKIWTPEGPAAKCGLSLSCFHLLLSWVEPERSIKVIWVWLPTAVLRAAPREENQKAIISRFYARYNLL